MDEEIKKLLKKNLEMTEDIREMVKSIKRYVVWQRIFGLLKVLIILIPIIIGVIYLPPLIKGFWSQYSRILGITTDPMNNLNIEDFKSFLTPDVIEDIK